MISTPWLFAIFVVVTIAIVWFLVMWTAPPAPADLPYRCPLNPLRDTRYGSYVLMLIPVALAWPGLDSDRITNSLQRLVSCWHSRWLVPAC